jgi:hypothetical protein
VSGAAEPHPGRRFLPVAGAAVDALAVTPLEQEHPPDLLPAGG